MAKNIFLGIFIGLCFVMFAPIVILICSNGIIIAGYTKI